MGTSFKNGQFVGALHDTVVISGLTLAETSYASGLHVPAHAHDHALCCLVLDGAFTERSGHSRVLCGAGTLVFHPQDEPHAHEFAVGGGRCFNIQFGAEWVARLEAFSLPRPGAPQQLGQARANWLTARLYEEFRGRDDASALAIEGLTLALLADITRSVTALPTRGAKPYWLRRTVEKLRADAARPWSLTALALEAGVDPTHLARTFRLHYGCAISEYVRTLRINAAREQLLRSELPLSEIAIATGFADQAHFTRTFKRVTGRTPGAFRREAR